jgi:putative endonuclease
LDSSLRKNSDRKRSGNLGEDETVRFLESRNVRILERNFRFGRVGEIDIIALTPENILCFVEVKTRQESGSWSAAEAIDDLKQGKLETVAEWYLQHYRGPCESCRFDAAIVLANLDGTMSVDYMENIF